MAHSRTALVIVGGDPLSAASVAALPVNALVIAADSGLDHARNAGIRPDLVVGDLDSISADGLAWALGAGIPIETHSPDKDATDTELALLVAMRFEPEDLVLVSGGGDRLDHSLGALAALGSPSLAACATVSAHWGDAYIGVLHPPRRRVFTRATDATFSVLALHGPCRGVELTPARWPLADALIEPGSTLGISNLIVTDANGHDAVSVAVDSGVLTVIIPHHFGGTS